MGTKNFDELCDMKYQMSIGVKVHKKFLNMFLCVFLFLFFSLSFGSLDGQNVQVWTAILCLAAESSGWS